MGDLQGVELARPGTWPAATGKTEFTVDHLRDAAEFFAATGGQAVPISLGHGDDRFSGEPSFGSLTNVRYVEDDRGPVLLGDIVDMPTWLSASAPKRWPNRSIEGWENFEYDGRTYRMVLTGLALLGVAPPAVRNIASLRDLQVALAASAAHRIVATSPDADPELVEAAADPKKPYGDVTYADPGYQKDGKKRYPLDSEEHCRAAWSYINQAVNAAKYTPEQVRRIKAAIKTAAKKFGIEIAASSPTKEGAGPMDPAKIREALGLPADASDEDVKAALHAAGFTSTSPPPPDPDPAPAPTDPEPDPEKPADKPQLVSASAGGGTLLVAQSVWDETQKTIKGLTSFVEKTKRDQRDEVIAKAVSDGKFTPAQRPHFTQLWDSDPEATRALIDNLTKNSALAVMASGYDGDSDEAIDREYAHLFPPKNGARRG